MNRGAQSVSPYSEILFPLRVARVARHRDRDTAAIGAHQLAVVEQGRHIGDQLLAARRPRGHDGRDAGHRCQYAHRGRGGRGDRRIA